MMDAAPKEYVRQRDEWGVGYSYETLGEYVGFDEYKKAWIIKKAIAWGDTSAWIGAPGSLKSALLASLAISASFNLQWFGRKSMKSGVGVVYFALERADLVRRRIDAQIARDGLNIEQSAGITIVPGMVDLATPESVAKMVRTVKNIEAFTGEVTGLLIFDTFAKLIAAGGGDENKAADQGKVFANMERVKEGLGRPHVAFVGHTGKDETRGARGSNAILGDVDMLVTITGEAIKTATVTKANDAPEGPLFSFKSEVYEFGKDEDGEPITVNIVSAEDVETVAAKPKSVRLTPEMKLALDALDEVLSSPAPSSLGLPSGTVVADIEAWKTELRRRGVLDPEHSNPPQQWKRVWERLAGANLIARRDQYVWRA